MWLISISVTVYLDFKNVFMSALSVKTGGLCEFSLLFGFTFIILCIDKLPV